MPEVTVPGNGWKPRPYQKSLWKYMEKGGRRAVAIWHRRAGKDDVGLNWTMVSAIQRVATYWHMLPQAAQARKAVWDAVDLHTGLRRIDEAFPKALRETTRDNEMFIRFKNGSTWQVVGSDNFNSLLGSPPYGIIYSEWALADPEAWAYLRPILVENGGWAMFITTPRGYNHCKTMYDMAVATSPDWFAEVLTARDTGVFTQEQLDLELKEYVAQWGEDAGRALFEQEFLCSWEAAILGAYYAGEMQRARDQGRITEVAWDPMLPVETYWDLGIDDSMSIWFAQTAGQEIHLIDYYEMTGEGLKFYADMLEERHKRMGYVYGRHVAPHDIRVRELGTGKSRWEIARDMGLNFEIANKVEKKEDAHQAVRAIFPRLWFDRKKCEKGISALSNYRKSYDETNKVFRGAPVHDWSSHASDAMATLATAHDRMPRAKLSWLDEAGRI